MAKRELIEVNGDKRYVTRAADGTFKTVVDVSASLKADARTKAKTKVKPGHGGEGDR